MRLNQILQGDYTVSSLYHQIKLPLDIEISIPSDDPVRLVSAFVEEMNLSDLYETYDRIRKSQASPRQMLKIVIYAAMNRIYSSRDIESSCKRDINFMYLLEGAPAPDHSTLARFISLHLSQCSKSVMSQVGTILLDLGEISGENIFIDGTKIESVANKYTFVWKKAVTKNMAKLAEKICMFCAECEELYDFKVVYKDQISLRTLKRLRKKLYKIKKDEAIEFVHGIGKRKTMLQRSIEKLEEYTEKLKEYTNKLYKCGRRNSYSKTDNDATFMRMKEDAMLNGQLKPAYNLQHGVDAEYVTWLGIYPNPTDTLTLIPFLKDMEEHLPFKYKNIVADAGYESEENYVFIENNDQTGYIKPQNYELSKTRKFKKDISKRENMDYDSETDSYTCKNGKKLLAVSKRKQKTATSYQREVTIYECESCHECPFKKDCIKGNNCKTPFEDRKKVLSVSRKMEEKRAECLERITSDYGTQLRMNRSIQAEGSFANVKEDMNFRRYLYKGSENVLAQSTLLAIAFDINKLHHKIMSERTGTHLFELKKVS
ncbi:IS1182 family transposase [Butyrivibrio fibrisolvens]|uniref:IS1182 family transposase n=1 Tax=Butyrivibrio fibrisolvens TaxID=831 RepID=UPI00200B8109|nr:IS1182 family transposase [Butyrivibrio fibrisolvens]